jgi:hypothetical protein
VSPDEIWVSVNFDPLNLMVVSSHECVYPLLVRYSRLLNFVHLQKFLVTFHTLPSGRRAVVSDGSR